jgi:PAS domain S-box-containing protein
MKAGDDLLTRVLRRFSRDMLLVLDAQDLRVAEVSDEFLKRLKYSRERVVGRVITEFDIGLSAMVFWDQYQRGMEDSIEASESEFVTADGGEMTVAKDVRRFTEEDREWLLVVIHDNSQAKRDQEICSRLSAQLKATLEAAGDGILVIRGNGQVMNMNRRFSAMWGMPDHILEGGSTAVHDWIVEQLVEASIYHHIIANLGEQMDNDDFFVLELKNGKVFELRVFPQLSFEDVEGYVLNFHDVTQHVQYEQALILEREKAEQSSQYKSDFLSNMSHELRTPMNAILGFSQLMEMDEELSAASRGYVQEMLKAGNHLLDLINEVLDLSHVESGHVQLEIEEIDIDALVEECLTLVRPLADQREVSLSYHNILPTIIKTDRKRLKQVLINLMSNAIKYNRYNGSVSIETEYPEAERLAIRVRDTGAGIAAARMAELFQPFSRLGADKSHIEGTGIGLVLTRRLVELMSGEIHVHSMVGEGSCFSVFLPQEKGLSFKPRPMLLATQGGEGAGQEQGEDLAMHILVVEDVIPNQLVARKLIEKIGHTVDIAENGLEAVKAVKRNRYDLVFMDMRMPEMDGLAATRAIRDLGGRYRQLPIIAMTANATAEDRSACLDAGMNDFVSKPINRVQLGDTLHAIALSLSQDRPK